MAFSEALDLVFSRRGWLSTQPPDRRRQVLELSRRVSFSAGEPLVHAGDGPGGIYGVVRGGVGCEGMSDLAGPTLGHIHRAGAWFGMGPLLNGRNRTMTFRAMEETEVVLAPLSELRPLMAADVKFAGMIARLTEEAAQYAVTVACELLIKDAPRRVAATLLRVTAAREGVVPASEQGFRISQNELGEMSGLSRNHINRIVSQMQASGYIEIGYNHVRIIAPQALADFVRGPEKT